MFEFLFFDLDVMVFVFGVVEIVFGLVLFWVYWC